MCINKTFDTKQEWIDFILAPMNKGSIRRQLKKRRLENTKENILFCEKILRLGRVDAYIKWILVTWDYYFCSDCKYYKHENEFSNHKANKACILCRKTRNKKYNSSPEGKKVKYAYNNSTKGRADKTKYNKRNAKKIAKRVRLLDEINRATLTDVYLRKLISKRTGLPRAEIIQDEVEVERSRMKLVRLMQLKRNEPQN